MFISITFSRGKHHANLSIINVSDSTAKLTSSATDYETAPSRRKAIALDEGKYGGRTVSRKEMMLENEEFPDEQFELDPDLYDICDEAQDDDEENGEQDAANKKMVFISQITTYLNIHIMDRDQPWTRFNKMFGMIQEWA